MRWPRWRSTAGTAAAGSRAASHRIFTDAHHIEHWLDGGETNLDNTVLLCRRHQRVLHEHGFSVERVEDELVFSGPCGEVVPAQGRRWEVAVNLAAVAAEWGGRAVTAETNAPGWDGQPVDYASCVGALA